MDKVITATEAAEMLNISRPTLLTYTKEKKIPCIQTLKGYRKYLLKDILEVKKKMQFNQIQEDMEREF
jgi:excisionase family DNA binding protein